MNRLKTEIGNVEFINPFILASGPPARNAEMIARAFDLGWGGAVTKTICLNHEMMVNTSPRITEIPGGLQNIELISPVSPKKWAEEITFLKRNYPNNVVIASISAEANKLDDWQKLALMMQSAGADVLELNFSCPHGLPEMGMGNTCSDIPELAGVITNSVKDVSKIPVWAKLSPNVNSIKHLAKVCLNNGADGITAINTVKGFAGIDIETGEPRLNVGGFSCYGGISGEIIKPVALKAVSEIASLSHCPISATGGIKTWQDSIEFILLGASTLQVCTEAMLKGYEIINQFKEGVEFYLKKHDIANIEQLRGQSLKYIKKHTELDKKTVLSAKVDEKKCIKCKRCFNSCKDSGYQAIFITEKGFPAIDSKRCSGCGLCRTVCPVKCINLLRIEEKICPNF